MPHDERGTYSKLATMVTPSFVTLTRQEAWDLVGRSQKQFMREGRTAHQALELVRKLAPTVYEEWAR